MMNKPMIALRLSADSAACAALWNGKVLIAAISAAAIAAISSCVNATRRRKMRVKPVARFPVFLFRNCNAGEICCWEVDKFHTLFSKISHKTEPMAVQSYASPGTD